MDWLQLIKDIFNNQSASAFIGAFAAFALVVINDWRRDKRKVKNISAEIEMSLAHAKNKLESVRNNRSLIKEHNRVIAAPILAFNTSIIRQLTAEVLSHLNLSQRRAIDALCYTMEATDEILLEAYHMAKELPGLQDPAARIATANRLLIEYEDAIVNLKRLMEMCENYVTKNYEIIVTKQYDRREYEEK